MNFTVPYHPDRIEFVGLALLVVDRIFRFVHEAELLLHCLFKVGYQLCEALRHHEQPDEGRVIVSAENLVEAPAQAVV